MKRLWHSVLLALVISLGGVAVADERQTHAALLELFTPSAVWSEEGENLAETSWADFASSPSCQELWQRLSPLESLDLAARRKAFHDLVAQPGDGPARFLQTRQLYLGWLYDGERGYRWAGLQPPQIIRGERILASQPVQTGQPFELIGPDIALKNGNQLDYLIVGSGPAGAVLGHQLSQAGMRVAVVERGSFVLPDRMDTREVARLKVGGGAVPTSDFGILVRNAQAVGGGSTVNVDLAFSPRLPVVAQRIEGWRRSGAIAEKQWTPEQVTLAYDWVVETIGTRTPSVQEINPNNRILYDGAQAVGLEPELYDLNTWLGRSFAEDKRSAVNGLILQAILRAENPLWLLPDLEVRKIVVEDGRAQAVEMRARDPWRDPAVWVDPYGLGLKAGESYSLRAQNIIVCAGAQGSAALLLRSGLGGPQVGRGLILHPSMPLLGRFPRTIDALTGTASTVYALDSADPLGVIYECMTGVPQYVALMLFGTAEQIAERIEDFSSLGGFGVLLVDTVDQENRIVLDSSGEPRVIYRLSAQDRLRFAKAVGKAVKIMLVAGAEEVYLPSAEKYLRDSDGVGLSIARRPEQADEIAARLKFVPGLTVVTSAHMQSSCKMGSDPKTSVVDKEHRVWGVEGLYVCDSSVFPTSVGANPMQMVYTVAKIFADQLLQSRPN